MATLIIAAGDVHKGDEAAPSRVADLVGQRPGLEVQRVHSLSPQLAERIGSNDEVLFIDADSHLGEPWMEAVAPGERNPLSEIIKRACRLFDFRGRAYVCHVPGIDFEEGAALSPYAESRAKQAALLVKRLLSA